MIVSVPITLLAEVAVIGAGVVEFTGVVVTVKVPLLCPAGIVIVAGTLADPEPLLSVTCTPPAPAGAVSVTVPVEGDPPVTGFGLKLIPEMVPCPGATGFMVRFVVAVLDEAADSCAVVWLFTTLVFTGKVPLLCPAGIVMLAGTVAFPLLLDRVTNAPLAPAAADNVTVPVAWLPPVTGFGATLKPVIVP